MIPDFRPPQENHRRRCGQAFPLYREDPVFRVTAEELARMHPLLRAVIGAVTTGAVEITTIHDSDGRVISAKTKTTKRQNSVRGLHSLLSTTRRLIEMERELAAMRSAHDLNGKNGNPPFHQRS